MLRLGFCSVAGRLKDARGIGAVDSDVANALVGPLVRNNLSYKSEGALQKIAVDDCVEEHSVPQVTRGNADTPHDHCQRALDADDTR